MKDRSFNRKNIYEEKKLDKPELEERKKEDYEGKETRKKKKEKNEGTSWIIPSISAKERRIRSVPVEIRINVAAEAEENAKDKRGQGALAEVGAERKLRGPCRREEGDPAFGERWRKKRRGWMGMGKAVSRLSDVEIDGKTRTGPRGRCEKWKRTRRTRRRKGRKGEEDEKEQSCRYSARCQIENRCLDARLETHPPCWRVLFSGTDCCSVRPESEMKRA